LSVKSELTRVLHGRLQEAEESPLLEAVARERLVTTKEAGKGSAGAVVNYKVSKSAAAL
jgi:hypothetical protein